MKVTDKRHVLRRIEAVRAVVMEEILGNRSGGKFARGLATEGFAGGYLQALDDIDAALRHGEPSDHRGYWRQANSRS
jgi:hypothetical protein